VRSLLEIANLTVRYGQALAVEKVSVQVPEKKLTSMIGPNGAGKTTILNVVSRLKEPDSGTVFFKDAALLTFPPHSLAGMGIAHCPEGRKPFREMIVLDNLLVGGHILSQSKLRSQLEMVLNLFPILKSRLRQTAGTLSGGELQMLAIGRALMLDPSLLLLDEPSLGLAPRVVDEVESHILQIKESGVTILMAEQNVDLVRLSDFVYILEHGTCVFSGTVSQMSSDISLSKTYLGI